MPATRWVHSPRNKSHHLQPCLGWTRVASFTGANSMKWVKGGGKRQQPPKIFSPPNNRSCGHLSHRQFGKWKSRQIRIRSRGVLLCVESCPYRFADHIGLALVGPPGLNRFMVNRPTLALQARESVRIRFPTRQFSCRGAGRPAPDTTVAHTMRSPWTRIYDKPGVDRFVENDTHSRGTGE